MREILVCENCDKIWTGDKTVNKYCSECYGILRPLNISDSLWERMSDVEKREILNNNETQIAISSRPLFKLKKPSVSSLLEFD